MINNFRDDNKSMNIYKDTVVYSLTLDTDWASEDALRYCYDLLSQFDIPMTFFITHKSKFITKLLKDNKIDAGIHPNF